MKRPVLSSVPHIVLGTPSQIPSTLFPPRREDPVICSNLPQFHIVQETHRLIFAPWQTLNNLICGNKMRTRCNRGFYCRSYCLLNMFLALLCPSSGAQEYYTVVAACGISCCGFQVAGLVWS